ncbi:cytoplasmic protein [Bacillus sp. AFS088145]|uniref:cytoplasmic protein n=1 Tax=Bacillus sp. AFS088145 TaxID=2033514 RepID=UPI000BF9655D|nr:cytoplasmic protein [Bacillus sp. AFS088145]PFH85395.1 cytoplasmic protein [Bacillus sp. AFS088145]
MENQYKEAHRFSSYHRRELEKDSICGCFYCLKIYSPSEINEWWDNEKTAVCHNCGIDSVIGESSGFPITEQFLIGMNKKMF